MIHEENKQFVEIEEAFIPPSLYPQIRRRPDCPDLSKFPDGIYILGKWGFSEILAVSPTPQLDAIRKEEQERSDNMPSRFERSRRRRLRDQPTAPSNTKIWFHETFVPPSEYDEIKGFPGMPDLSEFPNGFYMLGYNNFAKIVGFFPWSQLDRMKKINDILDQASESNGNTDTTGIEVLPVLREDAPDRVDQVRDDNDLDLPGSSTGYDCVVSDGVIERLPADPLPTDHADEGWEVAERPLAAGPDTTIHR
jgi:hypothetical protein